MNATTQNQCCALQELGKEALMDAQGEETFAREMCCIDLLNFTGRKNDIVKQLWGAVVEIGSFQTSHHGIPSVNTRRAFSMTKIFFDLPDEAKCQYPLAGNAGWGGGAQVRPPTHTPDQKESYQITRPLMARCRPSDQGLPAFKQAMFGFKS